MTITKQPVKENVLLWKITDSHQNWTIRNDIHINFGGESIDLFLYIQIFQAAGGDVIVWGVLFWYTLDHLVTTVQVLWTFQAHPFMVTVHPFSDCYC